MTTLKFVKSVWGSFRLDSGLEPKLLDNLRITAAHPGTVHFELDIQKHHTNRLQILHGGTIAALTDTGGSLAVASRGMHSTGISTDLSITYLSSGGKTGDVLHGEAVCDKFGRNMAFTSVRFMDAAGTLVARGSHSKFIRAAWQAEGNCVDEMREEEELLSRSSRDQGGPKKPGNGNGCS